jgi:hypothetical protein
VLALSGLGIALILGGVVTSTVLVVRRR